MKRLLWFALLGLLLLSLDSYSKWAIQEYLPLMRESAPYYPYGGVGVFPDAVGVEFSITHATNTGAIWGLFAEHLYILLAFRIVMIVGLVLYALFGKIARHATAPLLLIIIGACGNVLDVLAYGHVIDMLHFRILGWQYPIFNLADTFIFFGVSWLLILSLVHRKKRHELAD